MYYRWRKRSAIRWCSFITPNKWAIKTRPRTDHSSLNRFFVENCVALIVLLHEQCEATSSFSRTVSSDQFFSKNCVKWPVLFKELCQVTSSFSRTVPSDQFFSKNCVKWPVLFKELCQVTSSFQRTVSSDQFFSKNCVKWPVLFKELCQVTSSFQRTVSSDQFFSKNCGAEMCGASIFYDPRVLPVPEVKSVLPVPVNIITKYFPPLSLPL